MSRVSSTDQSEGSAARKQGFPYIPAMLVTSLATISSAIAGVLLSSWLSGDALAAPAGAVIWLFVLPVSTVVIAVLVAYITKRKEARQISLSTHSRRYPYGIATTVTVAAALAGVTVSVLVSGLLSEGAIVFIFGKPLGLIILLVLTAALAVAAAYLTARLEAHDSGSSVPSLDVSSGL